MKTYNEFRKTMKGKDKAEVSKAWKKYKSESLKTPAKAKSVLPPEIKTMNKKLTETNNYLTELRDMKQEGKDVKEPITKALKSLKEGREAKKAKMTELGL